MKTKLIFLLCLVPWLATGQISETRAKEIMGNKMITREEAAICWQDQPGTIKFPAIINCSEQELRTAMSSDSSGKSDFYLIPILGVSTNDLSFFWSSIYAPEKLVLKNTAGWRLIDFAPGVNLDYSWQQEKYKANARGMCFLPPLTYFEAVATIWLTRQIDKTSGLSEFYFGDCNSRSLKFGCETTLVYSADLNHGEAMILEFPTEGFIPLQINNEEISFGIDDPVGLQVQIYSCRYPTLASISQEKDYIVSRVLTKKF